MIVECLEREASAGDKPFSVGSGDRAARPRPWLTSPLWDAFWMLSGLWLLGIVLVAQGAGYVPAVPNLLAFAAVALLWGGHILSPVIVSWANRDLRTHMLSKPRKFIGLPLAILLISVALSVLGDLSQWPGT